MTTEEIKKLISDCKKELLNYPETCNDYYKIIEQINNLKERLRLLEKK